MEKRYATVVVRTNGSFEVHFQDDWHLSLEKIHELLGGGFFEVVNPAMLQESRWSDVRMLVDDCGLIKELPVNEFATILYASPWDIIVGDAIFCTTRPQIIEEEPDIYAFSEEDANALVREFLSQ